MQSSSNYPILPPLNESSAPYAPNLNPHEMFLKTNNDLISTLRSFLEAQMTRLDKTKSFVKGAQDKKELYGKQLTRLNSLHMSVDAQKDLNFIIKELAIISHHRRYSKWDMAARITTLFFTHKQSDSWKAWKELSSKLDDNNPFTSTYKQTLLNKENRNVENGAIKADNYNDYRDNVLLRKSRK